MQTGQKTKKSRYVPVSELSPSQLAVRREKERVGKQRSKLRGKGVAESELPSRAVEKPEGRKSYSYSILAELWSHTNGRYLYEMTTPGSKYVRIGKRFVQNRCSICKEKHPKSGFAPVFCETWKTFSPDGSFYREIEILILLCNSCYNFYESWLRALTKASAKSY